MSLESQKFCTSRDVVFHENVFSFSDASPQYLFPSSAPMHSDYAHALEDTRTFPLCSHGPLLTSAMGESPTTPVTESP